MTRPRIGEIGPSICVVGEVEREKEIGMGKEEEVEVVDHEEEEIIRNLQRVK